MMEIKNAIDYFEDAVKETNEIIADCSPALQAELTEQKQHFVVALEVMHEKAKCEKGCEHCRGWDKRCGANYCPMCGRKLGEYDGLIKKLSVLRWRSEGS